MSPLVSTLSELLADTYALYLKTQNFHWNVTGSTFKMWHDLFGEQYEALAEAVDVLAERIRTLGHKAPASFEAFQALTKISSGDSNLNDQTMVQTLVNDHQYMIKKIQTMHESLEDIGTVALLEDRLLEHEKMHWFLKSSLLNVQ